MVSEEKSDHVGPSGPKMEIFPQGARRGQVLPYHMVLPSHTSYTVPSTTERGGGGDVLIIE